MFYIFKIIFILPIFLFFYKQVFALDDGKYIGVWKTTYAHSESTAVKVDTGIFEFDIKDNEVIKILSPDDPHWDKYNLKYFFKINEKTDELSGYCKGYDPVSRLRFKVNLKGVFIDKKFAGEENTLLIKYNEIMDKFIFESIN